MRASEFINEAAGVGTIQPYNTTADVNKQSIKKEAGKFGNEVDLGGVPPRMSSDSNGSKKKKKKD
jgi:hypothetical protein